MPYKKIAMQPRKKIALIQQALRESFSRRQEHTPHRPIKLPTWGHGGLRPGIDLDDSASLLDLMA
jgi:hypothetical protein